MKSISVKKLYAIHSWVGLITGILMFVIALTGAISVFGRPELKIWANPEIRSEIELSPALIEKTVQQLALTVPEAYREEVIIYLPGARTFVNFSVLFEKHSKEKGEPTMGIFFALDNDTMQVIERQEGELRQMFASRPHDMADYIVDFHADLHMGRPIGLLLTGLLGLTLMLSVVTGFVIHRKKLGQLFTFRRKKSLDVSLSDAHKLFGVWGLIFHGVIGFTGAFLGLATVLLIPAAAFVSFGGDQEKLVETFTTMPEPTLAHEYQPTQLGNIISHATGIESGTDVTHFIVYGLNDKNAIIYANAIGGPQVARQIIQYKGNTGELVEAFGQFSKVEGFSGAILDLMFPLHFGNFGGIAVKIIWAILGLSTALLPLSGLMLWLERTQRSKTTQISESTFNRFNRLVMGSCGGIIIACIALFPAQLVLLKIMPGEDFFTSLSWVFFGAWIAAMILPFALRKDKLSAQVLSFSGAGLLLATPVLNGLLTGDSLFSALLNGQWVTFFVDLTLLVLGLLTVILTIRLSHKTRAEKQAKIDTNSIDVQEV